MRETGSASPIRNRERALVDRPKNGAVQGDNPHSAARLQIQRVSDEIAGSLAKVAVQTHEPEHPAADGDSRTAVAAH